jgi:holo-[acyl-carrier protein] synthase
MGGKASGIDMESISRVGAAASRETFLKRVFTRGELEYSMKKRNPERHLAGRFAAKEACAKALGTGISKGVGLKDIEVVNSAEGGPALKLHAGAGEVLGGRKAHLTITYEKDLALALVVIE